MPAVTMVKTEVLGYKKQQITKQGTCQMSVQTITTMQLDKIMLKILLIRYQSLAKFKLYFTPYTCVTLMTLFYSFFLIKIPWSQMSTVRGYSLMMSSNKEGLVKKFFFSFFGKIEYIKG